MDLYVDKILGNALPENSEETLVVRKTTLDLSGALKEKFPGSLSASLTKGNAALTRTKKYVISHNPDGSRYLLITLNDNIYLIDRSMRVFNATKYFPKSFLSVVGNNTLVDGYILKRKEIEKGKSNPKNGDQENSTTENNEKNENLQNQVQSSENKENVESSNSQQPSLNGVFFLIVDAICVKDQTVRGQHLEQRIKSVEQLFSPLLTRFEVSSSSKEEKSEETQQKQNDTSPESSEKHRELPSFTVTRPEENYQGQIEISIQHYQSASDLEKMFKKHFPSFGFPRAGILFSPSNEIYKLGYNEGLLVWKPMEQITVDFKVGIIRKYNRNKERLWYKLLKSNHGDLILHDWISEKGGNKIFSTFVIFFIFIFIFYFFQVQNFLKLMMDKLFVVFGILMESLWFRQTTTKNPKNTKEDGCSEHCSTKLSQMKNGLYQS